MKTLNRLLKVSVEVFIGLLLAVGMISSASAITNGVPDEDAHPYVGLIVFDTEIVPEEGADPIVVPTWRCTGSLIAPNVILTAGHCTSDAVKARVWFDPGPIARDPNYKGGPCTPEITGYPCGGHHASGIPHTYPDFKLGNGPGLPRFAYRDIGIIVLDDLIDEDITPAALPEAGLVDDLANKTAIDFVGYGVQYQEQIPGVKLPSPPPYYRWDGDLQRFYAPSALIAGRFVHSAEFLRLTLNPGGGSGGTCFGDSGGPDLLGGTNTILGVNSYVTNINCAGVGYSQRVDIEEVLDWIGTFLE